MIRKYLLIALPVSAGILAAAILLNSVVPEIPEGPETQPAPAPPAEQVETSTIPESCVASGGEWLFEYGECEYAGEEWCSSEGGNFNECASACRHAEPAAEMCTLQCVPVCIFNQEAADGEMTGPSLDTETAMGLVLELLGNCAEQNNCDKMEIETEKGADGVWRVTVTQRGLRDDSVKDKRTVMTALDTELGWRLEETLSEEFICQEGRGQGSFSPDPCN